MSVSGPRVLHVVRVYLPDQKGGTMEVIRQICLTTSRMGITSRVFAPSPDPDPAMIDIDGTTVVRAKLNFEIASCGFCLTGLREFRRQVDWADIVHYHSPWPFEDVMHFVCKVNKPTLLTYHADVTRQKTLLKFYAPLMNRFLDSVDRIVTTSEIYRETSSHLKPRANQVGVIPLGLDPATYPEPSAEVIEAQRAIHGEGFFFFVGMLRYYKGLHILLDACKDQKFRVVISGKGPMESQLKAQAKRLGLDNVAFTGPITDEVKVALLRLCKAVVFPSHLRAEAFGVTLLEGAMQGKPMVTAEVGSGTSYVNIHGETGLVVPPDDSAALANALEQLEQDPDLVEKLGQGALSRFNRLFTAEIMGSAYFEEYRRLLP